MRNPFRIIWAVVAMGAIIAYLSQGVSLTLKPEAMTWEDFSKNSVAMAHFAERNGLVWKGVPTHELEKAFEQNVTLNREFATPPKIPEDKDSSNVLVARLQREMRKLYAVWQPNSPAHQTGRFHFSPLWQLRWNIAMTMGVLLGLILVCTTGITLFERKAGV